MFKLNLLAFLLIGCSVFSFKLRDGKDECCETKTVGDVTYKLVKKMDTSGYDCISNCVYKNVKGNSSSSFCFKRGDLLVTCEDDALISLCPTKITDGIKSLLPKIKEAISFVAEIEKKAGDVGLESEAKKFLAPVLTFLDVVEKGLEEFKKFCAATENTDFTEFSICPATITDFIKEAIPLVAGVIKAIDEIKNALDDVGLGDFINPIAAEILSTVDIAKTILDGIKDFCDKLEADPESSETSPGICPVDPRCSNRFGECHPIICQPGFQKVGDCEPINNNCVCCVPAPVGKKI